MKTVGFMGSAIPFYPQLERFEFVRLYLHLEIRDCFDLQPWALLQLRRELLQALHVLDRRDAGAAKALRSVLLPELSADPVLVRQVQKPAPALVLAPNPADHGLLEAQQQIVLPLLLCGPAIRQLAAVIELFQCLGELGLHKGGGRFLLEGLECEDPSGVRSMLWTHGRVKTDPSPPICDLAWWLERQADRGDGCLFQVISPLRLMHRGRPLFSADFSRLFPFLLRRVSAMLAYYGGIDLSGEAGYFLSLAGRVATLANSLHWRDWRSLQGARGGQPLGGLTGSFELAGPELREIGWLLRLGTLFNLGKGAAFGAGQYRLNWRA